MARTVRINQTRYKAIITITAGTPIFVADPTESRPILADRLLVQMLIGGSGAGFVYDDVPAGMSAAQVHAGGDVAVELQPATATGPGGVYSDAGQSGVDLRTIAIDGSVTGDQVLVDAHLKI